MVRRNPFSRTPRQYTPAGGPSRPSPAMRRRALTAAAQIVTGRELRTIVGRWAWQKSAWEFYNTIGELHFAVNYLAQSASRARLYVGTPDPHGASAPVPTDDDPTARALLDDLGSDFTAHAELIDKMCIQLQVAGECFLIGIDDTDDPTADRKWISASSDQLRLAGDSVFLRTSPATQVELPEDSTLIIRVYFQDPQFSWQPTSHIRALLPDLARLAALNSHILATTDSRLAGAGVLFIGDSVSPPVGNPGDEVEHSDPFIDGLMKAMITPITDRNSAAAVVPYVVRVPDESLDKIKLVQFWTPFDQNIPTLIELTLKKIAIGLNMPPETLLGLGDTNHWSAWAIDENVVKLSVEPILSVICQVLTCEYMRPAYKTLENKKCESVIWFDTTELTSRPNKAAESLVMHDKGLINDAAVRRENGFSEEDAPTEAEKLKSVLWDLATNPASAPYVLPALGVNIPGLLPAPADADDSDDQDDEDTDDDDDEDSGDDTPVATSRAIPSQPTRSKPPAALPPGGSR